MVLIFCGKTVLISSASWGVDGTQPIFTEDNLYGIIFNGEENKATEDAQRAAENAKNGKTASPNVITPPDFTSKRGAQK